METHLSIMSQWIDRFERNLFFTYLLLLMLSMYHAGETVNQKANAREEERERRKRKRMRQKTAQIGTN